MERLVRVLMILTAVGALGFNVWLGWMAWNMGQEPLGRGLIVYTRHPEIDKATVEGEILSLSSHIRLVDLTPQAPAGGYLEEDVRAIEEYLALGQAAASFPPGTVLVRFPALGSSDLRVIKLSRGVLAVVSVGDDYHEIYPHSGKGDEAPLEIRVVKAPILVGAPPRAAVQRLAYTAARLALGYEFEHVGPVAPAEEPHGEGAHGGPR